MAALRNFRGVERERKETKMSGIRVLVANKSKAELYDLPTRRSSLKPVRSFVNPAGTKRESALGTSRPGRVMNRSGGGARQAYESKHTLKGQAEEELVREVAGSLVTYFKRGSGARMVLVAAPQTLGIYRRHLPAAVRQRVILEIQRDLNKLPVATLNKRVLAALNELPPSVTASWGVRRRKPAK
jgi:protein required for attachment to host cells